MRGQNSALCVQKHINEKTIHVNWPNAQPKNGKSAYILCQKGQIVRVIMKRLHFDAKQDKKLKQYDGKIRQ